MAERIDVLELHIPFSRETIKSEEQYLERLRRIGREVLKLRQRNRDANKEYRRLNKDTTITLAQRQKRQRAISDEIARTSAQLRILGRAQRDANREFDKLTGKGRVSFFDRLRNSVKGAAGALLVGLGIREVAREIGEAVNLFADFNRQISFLGAVSGASRDELRQLEENARSLGESTNFTASEVAALSVEFAKLGFTPAEILAQTADTLNLANVAQSDLGETAQVVGAVLNAFNLDASETGRVTDVLGASFSNSALDLSRFRDSFRLVGPVAAAFNFSLEDTTALLGTLVDAGFEASTAGTSLRSILLNLADQNGDLAQKLGGAVGGVDELVPVLIKLRKEGIDLNETLQLTDKRSVAAFNRFLDGAENVSELAGQLKRAEGFAAAASKAITDDLKGSFDLAKSATEGLRLNLVSLVEDGLRSAVDGYTGLISAINDYIKIPISEKLKDEQSEFNALVGALINTRDNREANNFVIDELQSKYPDYIGNLNLETASYDELQGLLADVNKELVRKIILQEQEEKLAAIIKEQVRLTRQRVELEKQIAGGNTFTLTTNANNTGLSTEQRLRDTKAAIELSERAFSEAIKEQENLLSQFGITAAEAAKITSENQDETTAGTEKLSKSFAELQKMQKELKNEILDAKIKGEPYAKQLERYNFITKQINAANALFAKSTKKNKDELKAALGSIKDTENQIAKLKKIIETSNLPDNVILEKLEEIVA